MKEQIIKTELHNEKFNLVEFDQIKIEYEKIN